MQIGSNPGRTDKLRLAFFEAVAQDLVEGMKEFEADDSGELGEVLARVASYFRAEGMLKAACLLEPHEDFEARLTDALDPFVKNAVVDTWRVKSIEARKRRDARTFSDHPVAIMRRERKARKLKVAAAVAAAAAVDDLAVGDPDVEFSLGAGVAIEKTGNVRSVGDGASSSE